MSIPANSTALAQQARRTYVEALLNGMSGVVQSVTQAARQLSSQGADPALAGRRRDLIADLARGEAPWLEGMTTLLRAAMHRGSRAVPRTSSGPGSTRAAKLSLVDDDTIDNEIVRSRLAMAVMDRASWEFTDLRSRMMALEQREELDTHDVLRPHVLAQVVTAGWREAGLTLDGWRVLQDVLQDEFAHFAEEAYHETNRSLIQAKVLPEIDLRPFIRRTRNTVGYLGGGGGGASGATRSGSGAMESRAPLRGMPYRAGGDQSDSVLARLSQVVDQQVRGFADTSRRPSAASPALGRAIEQAQQGIVRRSVSGTGAIGTPAMLEELDQRKQVLKQAATTPVERATIEIVALMFQSLLTEERIPASVRIWFARLQMPVLRVAVSEPDFFAAADHPARRLIDRMGACVMGFDATTRPAGEALDREIKRVVQVVEAYPDTGRRVFQTVLTEFERFLEHYFKNENEASRKGVSLAHQVEQRETLAIQYTIELRKMLNEVPVQEGVREFLFQVWADVLAMAAVKEGNQSETTKQMKRAAADLIWSAGAKVSRDERAEVIRRLPPLLKALRDGMAQAGLSNEKQDEHIQRLNTSLAAAFTAKTAAIPHARLEELMGRLETLEELLPEAGDVEIDESLVLDLSGHESSELEVVGEGGSTPTPAMLTWARELQVGGWYMLDYRERNEAVQLAWQGLRKQLALFVSPQGRAVLFQKQRLAAFLQAGLIVPAQDESLTVRATRSALAKIDVDPGRLLN
ncbi:MAG: DUF1631 family protein [Burkholderiaceae bacterium]